MARTGRAVPGRFEGGGQVGFPRGDERVEGGAGVAGNAEHEVKPALPVGESHREREIAAVVDDDVAFGGMVEMGECSRAFVFMAEQVEVDRDPVVEPVHGADHTLGVVGAVGDAVAALCQFPRQG